MKHLHQPIVMLRSNATACGHTVLLVAFLLLAGCGDGGQAKKGKGDRPTALTGFDHWPMCLAFSPDGKLVALGSGIDTESTVLSRARQAGQLCVWDVSGERPIQKIRYDAPVRDIAFSPDGLKLLITSGRLRVLRTGSWQEETQIRWGEARFYLDGNSLIANNGLLDAVRILSLPNGETRKTVVDPWTAILSDEGNFVLGANGRFVGSIRKHTLEVIDVSDLSRRKMATLTAQRSGGHGEHLLAVSPNGLHLITTYQLSFRVWGPSPDTYAAPEDGPWVRYAAFSLDGRIAAICGHEHLVLWDVEAGKALPLNLDRPGEQFACFALSPDGRVLAFVQYPKISTGTWKRAVMLRRIGPRHLASAAKQ